MEQSSVLTCKDCGAAATVFVSLVKNGQITAAAWCARHAVVAGLSDSHGYALVEYADSAERRRHENTPRCVVCDCSQRDFERQGRFGCPTCYSAFAGLLPTLLGRMHRDIDHRGKIPQRGADSATVKHRLAILQEVLNDAVRTEQFEWAAQTRDAMATLKTKLLAAQTVAPVLSRENASTATERKHGATPTPSSSSKSTGV